MEKIEDLIIDNDFDYEYTKKYIKRNLIENYKYYKVDIIKSKKKYIKLINKIDEIFFKLNEEQFSDLLIFLNKNYHEIINDHFLHICLEKLDFILLGKFNIFKKVEMIDLFNSIFPTFSYDDVVIVNFFENFIKNINNTILLDLFLNTKNLNQCKKINNWNIIQNYILSLDDNSKRETYIIKLMNIISRENKIQFIDSIRRKIFDSKIMLKILTKLLDQDIIDNDNENKFIFKKENKFKSVLKKILISFSLNDNLNLDFLNMFNLIDSKFNILEDISFMKIIKIETVIINISNNLYDKSYKKLNNNDDKKKYIINIFYLVKFIKLLELKVSNNNIDFKKLKKSIFKDIYNVIYYYEEIYHFKIFNLEEINYNHIFDNKKQIIQYILLLNLIIDKDELRGIKYIFDDINEKSRLIFDKVQLIKYIYMNKKTKDNHIFKKIIEYLKSIINKQYKVFFFEKKLITYNNFIDKIFYDFQIFDNVEEIFLEYEDKYKESDLSLFDNISLTIDPGYIDRFKKNVETTMNIININYDISKDIIKTTKEVLYDCQYLDLESIKEIEKRYKYLYSKTENNYEKDVDNNDTIF